MKFEDVKIGMEVINTYESGLMYNKVGTVYKILGNLIIVKYSEKTNSSCNDEYDEQGLWSSFSSRLEPFIDPEEDLIVWGALEAGEKFQVAGISSITYLKLNDQYYVQLGTSFLLPWRQPLHRKVLLVD